MILPSLDDIQLVYIRRLRSGESGLRLSREYWQRVEAWNFWSRMQIVLLNKLLRRTK